MKRYIPVLLIAIGFLSCQEDIDGLYTEKYISMQDFFVKNTSRTEKFSANSSSTINFATSKGTKIQFPSNAFVTASGAAVNGDVNIEIKEILNPMDMILSNKPSMSNGAPLNSGGEFYIRFTKNGEELKLASNTYVGVDIAKDLSSMKVFNGTTQADGSVNWVENNNNQTNFVFPDSLGRTKMFADSVNWINCDKFYNDPKITFTVLPGNCPLVDSTKIYLHLTGRNTVIGFPNNGISTQLIAAPATIVAICVKEGFLYAAIMPVTLQDGKSATLNFSQTTEADLKKKLTTLH